MDPGQSQSNIHSSESDTQGPGGGDSCDGQVPNRGVPVEIKKGTLNLFPKEDINLKKMCVGAFLVPWLAPLLLLDGSLQRLRQPSLQHSVPFRHLMLSVHVFFSPINQRRFLGGAGQVSAMKKRRITSLSETAEHSSLEHSTTLLK